jgi:MCP family monocarboxylic acid transporter-like MFS transporter 10
VFIHFCEDHPLIRLNKGLIIAGQYFTTKRGVAVGIVASGASVGKVYFDKRIFFVTDDDAGGVVFPFALNRMFKEIGFEATIRYTLLILGIPLILAIWLISSPMEPKGWKAGKRSIASIKVFKRKPFLLFTVGGFLFYWGLFAPFNYLPTFAMRVTDADTALYTVSIIK